MTSRSGLTALLAASVLLVVLGAVVTYRILLAIEAEISARLLETYAKENNLELKVEDESASGGGASGGDGGASVDMTCGATDLDSGSNYYASVNDHGGGAKDENDSKGGGGPAVARISACSKAILAFLTALLVLLAYLLLVVSDAPPLLARLGLLLCSGLVLQRQILHEVRNDGDAFDFRSGDFDGGNPCLGRGRYDRLAFLTAALLVVASALNVATYASRMVAEEDVYVGPARIVGYDAGSYWVAEESYSTASQSQYETTRTSQRTDLEVAWGDAWGCPHMRAVVECRADLEGALCEMDDAQVAEVESNEYGYGRGDGNLDDAVGEEEDSHTHEVYYDSNGEKVVANAEEHVEHSKLDVDEKTKHKSKNKDGDSESLAGGVVEDHVVEKMIRYNYTGDVDSYQEDESDTEYDADTGNLDYEMTEEESVDYTESGDVDTSEYLLDESTYNGTDGVLLESMVEEEVVYWVEGGGKEDTSEYLDVTYEENGEATENVGQLEDETYDITMTETNEDGQVVSEFDEDYTLEEKDGVFEEAIVSENSMEAEYYEDGNKKEETISDEYYVEGSDLSIEEEFVEEEEITYGEEGQVQHESVDEEEAWESGNGETEYITDHETIDLSAEGEESYNVTYEELVYDEDGNIVEDETEEYGGRRPLRNRNLGTLRRRRADETELQEAEEDNEELEEENEELKEENEWLKEQLEEEEEEENDQETADMEVGNDWDEADWNDVWGDYKCYNLFDADLDGGAYDAATPAGEDDWPYLKIYGNCRTCEAFVVDRFSAEHFAGEVSAYGTAGRNDAIAAALALGVAVLLAVRRRMLFGNGGRGDGGDNKSVNFLEEETARSRNGGSFAQGSGPRIMID